MNSMYDTHKPQDCFRYAYGMIEDDYGNLIWLPLDAWDNRWHFLYGYGYYVCLSWPILALNGHI